MDIQSLLKSKEMYIGLAVGLILAKTVLKRTLQRF
jgi:hypothetical protein